MREVVKYLILIFFLSFSYSCSQKKGTKENETISKENNLDSLIGNNSSLDSNNSDKLFIQKEKANSKNNKTEINRIEDKLTKEESKPKTIKPIKAERISELTVTNKDSLNAQKTASKASKKANPSTSFNKNKSEGKFGTGHSGDDDLHGSGIGKNGPGQSAKFGKIGHGEGTPPTKINNPTKTESGKVAIELTVDRKGRIIDVKVLANHRMTTTTDPVLLNDAKKTGYKFKFKADSKRAEYSKSLKVINYIIQD